MYNIAFTGVVLILIFQLFDMDQVSKIVLQTVAVFWGSFFSSFAFVLPRLIDVANTNRSAVSSRVYQSDHEQSTMTVVTGFPKHGRPSCLYPNRRNDPLDIKPSSLYGKRESSTWDFTIPQSTDNDPTDPSEQFSSTATFATTKVLPSAVKKEGSIFDTKSENNGVKKSVAWGPVDDEESAYLDKNKILDDNNEVNEDDGTYFSDSGNMNSVIADISEKLDDVLSEVIRITDSE